MNAAFYDAVRPLFGGALRQAQVDGFTAIFEAWEKAGDGDSDKLAYLLATTKHETAHTMQPIHERGQRAYFDKYEPGTKIGKALGNTTEGDGFRYRGRGFVQLTGRANYRKAGEKMSVNLLGSPDLALEPHIAAMALVRGCMDGWFTGKKLGDYIGGGKRDFVGARRVVNGTDRADDIAIIADEFAKALAAAPQPRPEPAKPAPATTAAAPKVLPKMGGVTRWVLPGAIVAAAIVYVVFFARF